MTGFESSGGRISGFIVWGIKYSTLDSLGGYVDFFHKKICWHLFSDYDVSAVSKCNLKVIGTDVERCLSMVRLSCKMLKAFPVVLAMYI